jgi:hypothetical protein
VSGPRWQFALPPPRVSIQKQFMEPTWQDHHDLIFWLWACLHDADAFLEASRRMTAAMHEVSKDGVHNFGRNRAQLNVLDGRPPRPKPASEDWAALLDCGRPVVLVTGCLPYGVFPQMPS